MWHDTQLHITTLPGELAAHVAPVQNRMFVKPLYGLWTSTYDGQSSAWVDWCRDEQFGDPDACSWFLLQPNKDARVYVVDTQADLTALVARYPDPTLPAQFRKTMTALDFEAISRDYDAVHLTHGGQVATRMSTPSLYGWDCESTVWFHWRFTSVEKVAAALV